MRDDLDIVAAFGLLGMEGWLVIGLLATMFLLGSIVFLNRLLVINERDTCDQVFEDHFGESGFDSQRDISVGQTVDGSIKSAVLTDVLRIRGFSEVESEHVTALVSAAISQEARFLQQHMLFLSSCVSGAPFIGLLGTVLGIILTFMSVKSKGAIDLAIIAPGVSAALLTTLVGLIVAIPSMLAINYLSKRIGQRLDSVSAFGNRLIVLLGVSEGEH